ncbi:MAG: MerP protein [Bacteroidetes bacterium HGW-Bacteroidetes-21]|jgi:copper chaperone CopZ|nr:MAG: MerP protein [Bacteroidetes bacterium HGW-Bacteroidetes-21]
MKNFIVILLVAVSAQVFAQKNVTEIEIMTSAQCGMCKDRIEKALAYEKGVIKSEVDLATKKVKVKYNTKKTNPDKIRLAISNVGHDADDIAADPVAYEKLPACCRKPGDPKKVEHGPGDGHGHE